MRTEDDERLFTLKPSRGVGTPMYMSMAALQDKLLCAADDFESLAYVLVYLAKDHLPWLDISPTRDIKKILELKDNFWNDLKVRTNKFEY